LKYKPELAIFQLQKRGFLSTSTQLDVPPGKFVETVKETGAKIVGLSGFLTPVI